jgi:transcriptional regulator with AAA-type ATPase domain
MTATKTGEGPSPPPSSPAKAQDVFIIVHSGKRFLERPLVIPVTGLTPETTQERGKNQPIRWIFGRKTLERFGGKDTLLSTDHLALWQRGDGHRSQVFVEDLGSKNGLYVDGERLPFDRKNAPEDLRERLPQEHLGRAEIRDGTLLRCGGTLLIFRQNFPGNQGPQEPLRGDGQEKMVGPFGLRGLRAEIEQLERRYQGSAALGRMNILLQAETGCGKEMLAQHTARRLGRETPFVPVNVKSIPTTLLTSEFFGVANLQGFTPTKGLIEESLHGTLFLDEIHYLDPSVQGNLLRFLETRDYRKIGATGAPKSQPAPADVLVLTAASKDLGEFMGDDLKTRLEHIKLRIPPLRERAEDIPELCKELLARAGVTPEKLAELPVEVELMEALLLHRWPGNVRELRNALDGLLRKTEGSETPGLRHWAWEQLRRADEPRPALPRTTTVQRILEALGKTREGKGRYNYSEAARALGMDDTTLRRWLGI